MEKATEKQNIVFAYFVKGEFKGWRADSFGTLSKKYPKIYKYSQEQVDIIKKNTEQELCNTGTSFMKMLLGKPDVVPMNTQGQLLDSDVIVNQVTKTEEEKRGWGEFEIKVQPFCSMEEWIELSGEGEEYKKTQFLENLEAPLEVHKFMALKYEN